MKPGTSPTISETLAEIGYVRSSLGSAFVWKIGAAPISKVLRAKVEIVERKGQFSISKCSVKIELNKVLKLLHSVAKQKFGKIICVSGSIGDDGAIKCVMEVAPRKLSKTERSVPLSGGGGSVVGWTTRIDLVDSSIVLQFSEAFAIGDQIDHWWTKATASTADALVPKSRKSWKTCNLMEISLPVAVFPVSARSGITWLGVNLPSNLLKIDCPTTLKKTIANGSIMIEAAVARSSIEHEAPLEILELRESAAIWNDIDQRISLGKTVQTFPDQAVLRLVDILSRIGADPTIDTQAVKGLLSQPMPDLGKASLLTLTGAMVVANKFGRGKDLVFTLSDLMRRIGDTYGPLSSIEPLAHLSAEILGDYWADIQPEMAFRSWKMSSLDGRTNARIQHKIANLARQTNAPEVEFDALVFLSEHERRTAPLESSAVRLINLFSSEPKLSKNGDDYLTALETIFTKLRGNCNVILALVDRWVEKNEFLRALTAIESCLSNPHNKLSSSELSNLNGAMAKIWHRNMDNSDLATARYVLATTAPADPSARIVEEAIQFYIETNIPANLERAITLSSAKNSPYNAVGIYEQSANFQALKGKNGGAVRDILRAIEGGLVKLSHLDMLDDWSGSPDIDLTEMATILLNADTSGLTAEGAASWNLSAGRWGLKRPDTYERGIEAFMHSKVIPSLSSGEAESVREFLRDKKRYSELSSFVGIRLIGAGVEEARTMTALIVNKGLHLDGGIFECAIAEHAFLSSNLDLSLLRAKWLVVNARAVALASLIRAHIASLAGSARLAEFLSGVSEDILASHNEIFSESLEEIFEETMVKLGIKEEQYSDFSRKFLLAGFTGIGEKFLRISIGLGQVVLESEDLVTSILIDDPASLAKWHYRAVALLPPGERQKKSGDTALKLWLSTDERPAEIIDLMIADNRAPTLDIHSMQMLEMLCIREAKIGVMIEFLDRRIGTSAGDLKTDLMHWCLRLVMSHWDDSGKAADLYHKWAIGIEGSKMQVKFTLSYLRSEANNPGEVWQTCQEVLECPEITEEPEILFATLAIFMAQKQNRKLLETIVNSLIGDARRAENNILVKRLLEYSIANEMATVSELNREFLEKFPESDPKELAGIVIQILIQAEKSPLGLHNAIVEWKQASVVAKNQEKWWSVVRLLTGDRMLARLATKSRCDLLYLHAKNMFDSDGNRASSAAIFESILLETPRDVRAWIPLYSLYEENGDTLKLIDHLERIIPLIELDLNILEKTPLTIEALRNSLDKARRKRPQSVRASRPKNGGRSVDVKMRNDSRVGKISEPLSLGPRDSADVEKNKNTDIRISAGIVDKRAEIAGVNANGDVLGSSAFALMENTLIVKDEESSESLAAASETQSKSRLTVVGSESIHKSEDSAKGSLKVEPFNWRTAEFSANNGRGMTDRVLPMAFASELEKHIAVQYVALLSGDTMPLGAWHWPVWRSRTPYEYSLNMHNRMSAMASSPLIGGSLHRMLNLIMPILIRSRQEKFLIGSKLASLGLANSRQSVAAGVNHPAIQRAGLKYFMPVFSEQKIALFDTTGLHDEVFFDFKNRQIHFDGTHQTKQPPGMITHRALEQMINLGNGNFGLLSLDASLDILPILEGIKNIYSSTGLLRLRHAFGMQNSDLVNQLKSISKPILLPLLAEAGSPTVRQIFELQFELKMQGLTTILATTLDLIGLLESLTNRRLVGKSVLLPNSILEMTPYARGLLSAAKKLNI